MLRLTAALLVRVGLVMLVMAVLVRLLPMPDRADVVADEFAIAVSLVLTLAPAIYLRLTRDTEETGRGQADI
ncbi:MAG: hypothetical protein ACRDRJ_16515 [Streptosporangiaceae bacterium]